MEPEILMLASSYGACFQPCTHHPQKPLAICANRAEGLFKNLRVNKNGSLSLSTNASSWDHEIYRLTYGQKEKKLSQYSCIIFNIYIPLDLPLLLQNNFHINAKCLKSISKSQLRDVLKNSVELQNALNLHRNWIKQLNIKEHFTGKMLFLANPYSSNTQRPTKDNNDSIAEVTERIQDWVQEYILSTHEVKIILPNSNLFENGFHIRSEYCRPDKYRDWKTLHQNKQIAEDRIHKNQKYGERLYKQILELLSHATH